MLDAVTSYEREQHDWRKGLRCHQDELENGSGFAMPDANEVRPWPCARSLTAVAHVEIAVNFGRVRLCSTNRAPAGWRLSATSSLTHPRHCRAILGNVAMLYRLSTLMLLISTISVTSAFAGDFETEPIKYSDGQPNNVISKLQTQLDQGDLRLKFDSEFGYLPAVLEALKVPRSTQGLVFSKTSFQRQRIAPRTPRAIYFNDDVYVGYCQNGDVVEISAVDPVLGTVFYSLDQEESEKPKFLRHTDNCLICHGSTHTLGVPGHMIRSVYPDIGGYPVLAAGTYRIDHTSPLHQRWGGWYVTGTHGSQKHLGNLIIRDGERSMAEEVENTAGHNVSDLGRRFDTSHYLVPHSDIVALMVLEHQGQAHNLITRANFETRSALYYEAALNRELKQPFGRQWDSTKSRIRSVTEPLVKYLLFCNEAELTAPISGTSGFTKEFAQIGPKDNKGRSLRDLDLSNRMFKHPCSYLIYSEGFDALPDAVKSPVYQRLYDVLSGKDTSKEFAHLSNADRTAIIEILRSTKKNLPEYWYPDTK